MKYLWWLVLTVDLELIYVQLLLHRTGFSLIIDLHTFTSIFLTVQPNLGIRLSINC